MNHDDFNLGKSKIKNRLNFFLYIRNYQIVSDLLFILLVI